ncbi:hypothetical protein M770_16570 [Pseudomonas aeruginosa VRFPA03]|nr:hypothetical protein M770_16570 [Pseudomonas aeruginosa VRFPA03]
MKRASIGASSKCSSGVEQVRRTIPHGSERFCSMTSSAASASTVIATQ